VTTLDPPLGSTPRRVPAARPHPDHLPRLAHPYPDTAKARDRAVIARKPSPSTKQPDSASSRSVTLSLLGDLTL
jgi:hypothetical protein